MSDQTNPLISGKRLPGSRFQLPSQGQFYDDGELGPDVVNGEVMVYPMTTFDEILYKSPDLLLSGEAIERVFERCIPDIKKPLRLLSGDVDFLSICLRSVSFGHEVSINHSHSCDNKSYEYMISIHDFVQRTKSIDPTTIEQQFIVNMNDGKTAHFTPIRYDAMLEFLQIEDEDIAKPEDLHDRTSRQLAKLISYVTVPTDDRIVKVKDQEMIAEWIKQLDIKSIKLINDKMQQISSWGTDIKYVMPCKGCKKELGLSIPLNPMHFFTQH